MVQEENIRYILEIIVLSEETLNTKQIVEKCQEKLSRKTVYEGLKELVDRGEILKKDGKDGREKIYEITNETLKTKITMIKNLEENEQYEIDKEVIGHIIDLYLEGYFINKKNKITELFEFTGKESKLEEQLLKEWFFNLLLKHLNYSGLSILVSMPEISTPFEIAFDKNFIKTSEEEIQFNLMKVSSLLILRTIGLANAFYEYLSLLNETEKKEEGENLKSEKQPFQLTIRYTPIEELRESELTEILQDIFSKAITRGTPEDKMNEISQADNLKISVDFNELFRKIEKAQSKITSDSEKYFDVYEALISCSTKELDEDFRTGCRNVDNLRKRWEESLNKK